jgi:tRNA/tmRNA/rRNA uracil-C5-methylase (TrmA/RlmC/RlmD family)
LTGWAFGGEALGRADDGLMIFAPFCIPGEQVLGEVIEARTRWARIFFFDALPTSETAMISATSRLV